MSPAPETLRRPSNAANTATPSLSISTILSRAPRAPNDSPTGPFSADRRASNTIRHHFASGPRLAPFQRQTVTLSENNPHRVDNESETNASRAILLSALEARRRRLEELRGQSSQTNITTTIAEQWRRQRDALASLQAGPRRLATSRASSRSPEPGSITPPRQYTSPPRLFIGEDSSDSETDDDDDDPDNKFSSSMNDIRRTPPPTFLTPNTSPSSQSTASPSSHNDDDSSRCAYTLSCKFCANVLTKRGMRARLVADARVHIWSTDEQPKYFPHYSLFC
jgi:FAM72 protein